MSFSEHLDLIGDIWGEYINKDAMMKFKEYGYYKMELPETVKGKVESSATLIILNT